MPARPGRRRRAGESRDRCADHDAGANEADGSEAAAAGFYQSPGWNKDYPRIQILTVAELLGGKAIQYPPGEMLTFKKAPKAATADGVGRRRRRRRRRPGSTADRR